MVAFNTGKNLWKTEMDLDSLEMCLQNVGPFDVVVDTLNTTSGRKQQINDLMENIRDVCNLCSLFNPLPNVKSLVWSKLKAFADDRVNVAKTLISIFDKVENIVGKGENAVYQHFLLFPHNVFKWLLALWVVKVWIVW